MESEIWSATLSGCPSDTDSDVNKYAIWFYIKIKKVKSSGNAGFDIIKAILAFFKVVASSQIFPLLF
jgi:hypothetical protein